MFFKSIKLLTREIRFTRASIVVDQFAETGDRPIDDQLDRLEALLQADLWAGPPVGRIDLRFEERAILHASVDL